MLFTCNVAFPKPLRIVCLSLIHKNDDQSGTPSASKYEASTVDNNDAVNIGIEHVQLVDQLDNGTVDQYFSCSALPICQSRVPLSGTPQEAKG